MALVQPMPDPKPPISSFTLTPQRIMILVLGILAVLFIIGGIFGGVGNYQLLREATPSVDPAAASSSAS